MMEVYQQLHQGEGNHVVFVIEVHLNGCPKLFNISHESLRANQDLNEAVHVACVAQIRQPEGFVVPLDFVPRVNPVIDVVLIIEDAQETRIVSDLLYLILMSLF